MAAQTRQSSGAHLASRFGALAFAAGVTSKITCKADRDALIELVREVVRRETRRKNAKVVLHWVRYYFAIGEQYGREVLGIP